MPPMIPAESTSVIPSERKQLRVLEERLTTAEIEELGLKGREAIENSLEEFSTRPIRRPRV